MCAAAIPTDHDRRWMDNVQGKKKTQHTILRWAKAQIKRKHCSHIKLSHVRVPGSMRYFVIVQLNEDYVH